MFFSVLDATRQNAINGYSCMSIIVLDITMSLDGFGRRSECRFTRSLGDDGECLHNWLFGEDGLEPTKNDRRATSEMFEQARTEDHKTSMCSTRSTIR
jgi:hypothetical protein